MIKFLEWLSQVAVSSVLGKLPWEEIGLLWLFAAIAVGVVAYRKNQHGLGWFCLALGGSALLAWHALKAKLRELETETD